MQMQLDLESSKGKRVVFVKQDTTKNYHPWDENTVFLHCRRMSLGSGDRRVQQIPWKKIIKTTERRKSCRRIRVAVSNEEIDTYLPSFRTAIKFIKRMCEFKKSHTKNHRPKTRRTDYFNGLVF